MQLTYVLKIGSHELTQSEIERLICEYAHDEGIIAYEMNFHDFKEVGLNTYKKASVLAKFANATVYIPTDVIAKYFHKNEFVVRVSINHYGAWNVDTSVKLDTLKEFTAAGKTVEYALTSLVLKVERYLHDNRSKHSVRSFQDA